MITVVNKYKEPNHIYCGRGSALGNPFVMKSEKLRDKVCDQYNVWFQEQLSLAIYQDTSFGQMISELEIMIQFQDINLGCFCAPKRCHCDTIKTFLDSKLGEGNEA